MALGGYGAPISEEELRLFLQSQGIPQDEEPPPPDATGKRSRPRPAPAGAGPYGAPIVEEKPENASPAQAGSDYGPPIVLDDYGKPTVGKRPEQDPYGQEPAIPDFEYPPEPTQPNLFGGRGALWKILDSEKRRKYNETVTNYNKRMAVNRQTLDRYKLERDAYDARVGRTQRERELAATERWRNAQAEKAGRAPVDTNRTELDIWMEQNEGRPISEYWQQKEQSKPREPRRGPEPDFKDLAYAEWKQDPANSGRDRIQFNREWETTNDKAGPTPEEEAEKAEADMVKAQASAASSPDEVERIYAKRRGKLLSKTVRGTEGRVRATDTSQPVARAPKGIPDGPTTYKGKKALVRNGKVFFVE